MLIANLIGILNYYSFYMRRHVKSKVISQSYVRNELILFYLTFIYIMTLILDWS